MLSQFLGASQNGQSNNGSAEFDASTVTVVYSPLQTERLTLQDYRDAEKARSDLKTAVNSGALVLLAGHTVSLNITDAKVVYVVVANKDNKPISCMPIGRYAVKTARNTPSNVSTKPSSTSRVAGGDDQLDY